MTKTNHKIVILGCGLSGMITALGFASKNIHTTIIEENKVTDFLLESDIRSTALTYASKQYFTEIGLWKELSELAGEIKNIYVADNKADEMLHFASSDLGGDEMMGYLIKNSDLKKLLFKKILDSKLIKLIEDTKYKDIKNKDKNCLITLNNNDSPIECDLVIVADGRKSFAKEKYFSPYISKTYPQHAITFIAHHQKSHEGTAVEHFMPSGPFAILPLKPLNHSSIVWTVKEEQGKALMKLPREDFIYLVQENFGEFLGKVKIEGEIAAFPLSAYVTRKYFNKRVVLVADTAHIIHPLAGQGLNQGIKDIKALISIISRNPLNISKQSLLQYQELRKRDNMNMFLITDNFNRIFSNNSKIFHGIRQLGFKAIESIPFAKQAIVKYAMGYR